MQATQEARALLVALCLCMSPLVACAPEPETPEPVIRPVRHVAVLAGGERQARSFSGTSRAGAETNLSFRVSGRVERLDATVGQRVAKDEVLAILDPTDLDLQVQEARAALTSAQAEAQQAAADNERMRKLYENDNASKSEFDRARAAARSAEAGVKAALKRLQLADRQLGYTRLLAPVTGRIAAVDVEENENVSAGQPVIMLTSGATPEVEIAIPENVIMQIREGDTVSVSLDALPGEMLPAVVTEVGVAAFAAGASFPVKVRLEESKEEIRSGMAATVHFRFREEQGERIIRVPPVAVGEDLDGRFVYVLEPTGAERATARRRKVAVGRLTQDGMAITEGLEEGELIATAGVRRLVDGQSVRLLPEHLE